MPLRVALPMGVPGRQGHMREELGQGQGKFHLDVRETYDLHVSDRQSTFWHASPPSCQAWIPFPSTPSGGRCFDHREETAANGPGLPRNGAPLPPWGADRTAPLSARYGAAKSRREYALAHLQYQ